MIHTTQEYQIGDNVELMREMPAESIDTIVTSPPYWGLRDYGVDGQIGLEPTLEEYHTQLLEVTAECMRVLKPTGVMFWNHGDSYGGNHGRGAGKGNEHNQMVSQKNTASKCLAMQNERLIIKMVDDQGWILRNRIIWCLSSGTRLYVKSQKGIMPMTIHDMVRLDPSTIQLWNGDKWTQVLGWSETTPPDNPIKIILRSGDRISCTPEHKFPTTKGMVPAKELHVGDILKSVVLPQPTSPDRPYCLPDDDIGWLVGMYMAEGSLCNEGNTIQISSHVKETKRYEKLQMIADKYGGTCRMYNVGGNAATINMHGGILIAIIKNYIYGNTAHNKHLRIACWNRNNTFIEAILHGYLEGDGHYDMKNDRWRLGFTCNYAFESDLRTLCARLCVSVRINRSIAKIGDKEYPAFKGEIRFNRSSHGNTKQDTEIVDIKRAHIGKYWSIGVADEPHVFALSSGVLTSNSKPNGMPSSVADRFSNKYEPVYMLVKSKKYWFDLDAVRVPHKEASLKRWKPGTERVETTSDVKNAVVKKINPTYITAKSGDLLNTLGKNPGDVWTIPTQPYPESHFATFPTALIEPMIKAACPAEICPVCGMARERITEPSENYAEHLGKSWHDHSSDSSKGNAKHAKNNRVTHEYHTVGWSSCDCNAGWIAGTVLDPFCGSGTVLEVCRLLNRNAIGLELNPDYEPLIRERSMAHTPPLTAY